MSKLSCESVTEQEAKLKEKDGQIKETGKIIGQQKVEMELLKKSPGRTKYCRYNQDN